MKHLAAYMLAVLGGNANPSSSDIEKILSSVGIDAESDSLERVLGELKGKNVDDLVTAGLFCLLYIFIYSLLPCWCLSTYGR